METLSIENRVLIIDNIYKKIAVNTNYSDVKNIYETTVKYLHNYDKYNIVVNENFKDCSIKYRSLNKLEDAFIDKFLYELSQMLIKALEKDDTRLIDFFTNMTIFFIDYQKYEAVINSFNINFKVLSYS
ncbi:MAG TPA: hypothetical protein GX747_01295, partial [Tenericutes bacterium]|nr:hypothetical protein [Mycoplasmatota bacterium]